MTAAVAAMIGLTAAQSALTNWPSERLLVNRSGLMTLLISGGNAAWITVFPMPISANAANTTGFE